MQVRKYYLNTYESQNVHTNLNLKYQTFQPSFKNGIYQIANALAWYTSKGINSNLYFKARANSPSYLKNKQKSINFFKKHFKKESPFLKAIKAKPSPAVGASRNTYKKLYQLHKRSRSNTHDNIKYMQNLKRRL